MTSTSLQPSMAPAPAPAHHIAVDHRVAITIGTVLAAHVGITGERYLSLTLDAVAIAQRGLSREDEAAAIAHLITPELLMRQCSAATQQQALQQLAARMAEIVVAHQRGDAARVGDLLDDFVTTRVEFLPAANAVRGVH